MKAADLRLGRYQDVCADVTCDALPVPRFQDFSMMLTNMRCPTKDLKILNSIIGRNAVDVMDYHASPNRAVLLFIHHPRARDPFFWSNGNVRSERSSSFVRINPTFPQFSGICRTLSFLERSTVRFHQSPSSFLPRGMSERERMSGRFSTAQLVPDPFSATHFRITRFCAKNLARSFRVKINLTTRALFSNFHVVTFSYAALSAAGSRSTMLPMIKQASKWLAADFAQPKLLDYKPARLEL